MYRHSIDGEADITRITATPTDDSVQVTHHSWRIPPAEQTTYESVFQPGTAYLLRVKLDSGLKESYGVSIADGQDPVFVSVGLFEDEIDVNTVWT